MKAINLMATTANGVQVVEIEDFVPECAFVGSFGTFMYALRNLLDGEVVCYKVLPAGTDGEFEQIDAEYGIR